jgi:MSHA biogenesis protein MshQ
VPDSDAQIATNAATPNFGQESTLATAALAHSLNAPAGGNAGTLGGNTSFTAFSAGAKTQSVNWSEVGFIDLHAASANYLGGGQSVTNSSAGLTGVGRFIPDHFSLSAGVLTNRTAAACAPASSFSYLGEGMRLQFTLTAQNTANATTQNYDTASGFAKLPTVPAGMGFGAVDGTTNLTSRLDLGNSGVLTWSAGAASVDYTLAVNRASPDDPDGPFGAAKIGVAPSDGDGVTLASSAYDMDVDNNSVNEHQQVGASTQLLFGRLLLRNALGPAASALPVPISIQSWQGSAFGTNALDSCTKIPQSAIVLGGYAGALAPAPNCNTYVQQNPVSFSAGVATLTLTAPAGAATGSVLLTPNLYPSAAGNYCAGTGSAPAAASAASMPYLLGRWNDLLDPDANASTMYDDNPSARAAFGLFGSQPDNLIFQRENY